MDCNSEKLKKLFLGGQVGGIFPPNIIFYFLEQYSSPFSSEQHCEHSMTVSSFVLYSSTYYLYFSKSTPLVEYFGVGSSGVEVKQLRMTFRAPITPFDYTQPSQTVLPDLKSRPQLGADLLSSLCGPSTWQEFPTYLFYLRGAGGGGGLYLEGEPIAKGINLMWPKQCIQLLHW